MLLLFFLPSFFSFCDFKVFFAFLNILATSVFPITFALCSPTVSIKFATPTDARKTVAKVKKIKKPYARKIQILTVGEQRAKVMKKTQVASIFKKGKEAIRKKHGKKKRSKTS